jgi:hypothetical protein
MGQIDPKIPYGNPQRLLPEYALKIVANGEPRMERLTLV